MTVATTTRKQQFTLNGVTSAFDFTFRALTSTPTDIKAKTTISSVDADLVYTTAYTVAINSNGIGGTVTLVDAAGVGSGTLTVYRETTNTQASDYDDYNQFPADTLETDLDIRTMVAQEGAEASDRILQLPISYTGTASTVLPTPIADRVLGWDGTGSAIENKEIVDATTLTKASQSQAITATNNTTFMTPWRVFEQTQSKAANIASAASIDLGAAAGYFVDITGTTQINSLGTANVGIRKRVRFTGALTLSHSTTALILPGDDSITTAANDTSEFISLGSGNWICSNYKVQGSAPGGGDFEFVVNTACSAVANIDFNNLASGYDYLFVLQNVEPAGDGVSLEMRTAPDTVPTFDTGSVYTGATTTATSIRLSNTSVGSTAGEGISTQVVLYNPGDSGAHTHVKGDGILFNSSDGTAAVAEAGGKRDDAAVVQAARFFWSDAGNFTTTGNITVFRRKRS